MNIIKYRKVYIAISIIIIAIGIGFMIYNKSAQKGFFNYDVQFVGGTSIQADIGQNFENKDILKIFQETTGVSNPQIQKIGTDNSVIIKTKSLNQEQKNKFINAICEKYKIDKNMISIEEISATISSEMKKSAFLSVFIACLCILLYTTLRFKDFKIGTSAIIALIHDALIVLSFYSIFRIPLNNSFIAAILTILGYSINASIVIFDRVRENKRKNPSCFNDELINKSVKQTLKRSIFTSLTTFFTVICLYLFGVQAVKNFALPIVIGIIAGTYSSVFISGSVWFSLSNIKTK